MSGLEDILTNFPVDVLNYCVMPYTKLTKHEIYIKNNTKDDLWLHVRKYKYYPIFRGKYIEMNLFFPARKKFGIPNN